MTASSSVPRLEQIVALSRQIAEPHRELVILAEGNTSMRTGADRMVVKATGSTMVDATDADFVEVDLSAFWALLDSDEQGDASVDALFGRAVLAGSGRPSVESLLHAVCQRLPGVDTVVHTHPVPVNGILCSDRADALVQGALFPDQIVVLGRHPLLVPYVDPGLPLAREVARRVRDHTDRHGRAPRVVYLRNHGMFALGSSPEDALAITDMAVKVSRVLGVALSIGTPTYLDPHDAERIDSRPDERLRRQLLNAER